MSTPDRLHPDAPVADLQAWWMPFTHNRLFKDQPRLITGAQGAYYTLADGRRVFDGLSGLWCSPLGHSPPRVVEAVQRQVASLDFCPGFQLGHPAAFSLAARIARFADRPRDRVFFVNSGSEAVDTALKIAVAYHRARGEASRTRIIGRERAYHGVGIGGISVGGIAANRKTFAPLMIPGVDHLPHTWDPAHMRYSRGQPAWGAHLADELERLVALHDASNIAAVIVEPMQGSTGVVVPPRGYLEKLREICTRHGILLIFDEVITGFGRLGAPFAANAFGVRPDLITFAKAVNNATVPLGGVIVAESIYDAFMTGPAHLIEFFHGYTYSGHPLAVAAAHATLDEMETADLLQRVRTLAPVLEQAIHELRDEPQVTDIRNLGLAAAIDITPLPGKPGLRAFQIFERALDKGLLVRFTGETLALAPPFVSSEDETRAAVDALRRALRAVPAP
ncbi:MAG: aspartate aminotransferase family protein [Steroidobacteraceae bacterium]|nr:aspartate aminotransferase family protein [Nevskiaceae bacterium]MCP5359646.1 aspartate aminotransferase family protein [Nevskiaceae bacterium]MCP5472560.1 aspartate aminotransferase family protein [Nevskiaceae bacterium]